LKKKKPLSRLIFHSGVCQYVYAAGLPDGISAYQKSPLGYILKGQGIKNVDIFYGLC
jgi:hypothetical protein